MLNNVKGTTKWEELGEQWKFLKKIGLTYKEWKDLTPDEKLDYEIACAFDTTVEEIQNLPVEEYMKLINKYLNATSPYPDHQFT